MANYETVISTSNKGRKTYVVGRQEAKWDSKSRAYTKLCEQGFAVLGWKFVAVEGKVVKFASIRVSNVYLLATQSYSGEVHYCTLDRVYKGYTEATTEFKKERAIADFECAKKYLLKAFPKMKWTAFEEMCDGLITEATTKALTKATKIASKQEASILLNNQKKREALEAFNRGAESEKRNASMKLSKEEKKALSA